MPDIAKLPELAEIFDVSIDDILGKSNAVLHDVVSSQQPNVEAYSDGDISEAVNMLKPSQLKTVLENTSYHPHVLTTCLPFLSESVVGSIADEHFKSGKSIHVFLPFLSEEKVEEFVKATKAMGKSITNFLPFLKESTVKSFAFEAFQHGGIDEASAFLPFMNENDVLELIKLASQSAY